MTKNYKQWVEKLKAGTLVAHVSYNHFYPCIFKTWTYNQEGAHFIDIPWDQDGGYFNNDYWKGLQKGIEKPWISFINTNATKRFMPYPEDFLSQNQKKFYKLIKLMLS